MNRQSKPLVYKRAIAYLVDVFIIAMASSLITVFFPKNDAYEENLEELSMITQKYEEKAITETEFNSLYEDVNYELTKNSVDSTLVLVAITLLYFVLVNYYNDGVTIGKRLMKIKITSANEKKLTINNYLLRCLIVNSVLSNIISVVLIEFLSKEKYILYNEKISLVFSIVYVLCFIFALYRNDGRGLHDLLCNTKVVKLENVKKEEVKEIEVVKEVLESDNKDETKEEVKEIVSTKVVKKSNNSKKNSTSTRKKTSKGSEK